MGVKRTLEIVSSFATDPHWIWYLADAANALQGALIFYVYVINSTLDHTAWVSVVVKALRY